MKRLTLCILFFLFASGLGAQALHQDSPARFYDQQARFPGDSLYGFLNRHLKLVGDLPDFDGSLPVIVRFSVDATGRISTPCIQRSSGNAALDNEVVRVILLMPPWLPARRDGSPLASEFQLPLTVDFATGTH